MMARKRSWNVVQQAEYVTISELVPLSGIRCSTIKYYTEEGMLPFEQEEARLARRYQTALQRLQEIRGFKGKGTDD
jgi:DNA-binding transcriptional MerR regulator